ncbi:MAG: helix-turn-helix domain-containing protein [Bacteroidota bacterium]
MQTSDNYRLTPAQQAVKFINQTNRHIFLTGKAGTGKTTFLKKIIQQTHKKTIVVAPTGIAAINAGGVTIHSQFQLPFGAFIPSRQFQITDPNLPIQTPDSLLRHMQMNITKRNVLKELELLIIDEVSMLRADILDAIDHVLKTIRKNHSSSFGGVQVLFIGDLHQLPPVVKDIEWQLLQNYYKSILFFNAQVLAQDPPLYIELDKIYRQSDPTFIDLLNNLRNNRITKEDIALLNQYYQPDFKLDKANNTILLTTHNNKADTKNREALNALKNQSYFFDATIQGEFSEYAYPVEQRLELKMGTQVMFTKNDPTGSQRFFNGKIALIKSIKNDEITVKLEGSNDTLTLEKYVWKNIKYALSAETGEIEENEIGSFTQYPIKLAWAITVHKSQGLTFERAVIDIGDAFAPGQVYVALSRLKTLDGLILTAPANHLRTFQEEGVLAFGNTKSLQGDLDQIITEEAFSFSKTFLSKCFNFTPLIELLEEHVDSYTKENTLTIKQKHHTWALKLLEETVPYKALADKFCREMQRILHNKEADFWSLLHNRIESALKYFTPVLQELLQKVVAQKAAAKSDKKAKGYLKELGEVETAFFKQLRDLNKSQAFIKSILDNTEFTKQTVNESYEKSGLIKATSFDTDGSKYSYTKTPTKVKKEKSLEKKIPTNEVSFQHYKQGLTIAEIAIVRNLTETTIAGHFTHYISIGEVDVQALMPADKVNKIMEEAERLGHPPMSELKHHLGEDYSYTELRFTNAFKKYKESLNN